MTLFHPHEKRPAEDRVRPVKSSSESRRVSDSHAHLHGIPSIAIEASRSDLRPRAGSLSLIKRKLSHITLNNRSDESSIDGYLHPSSSQHSATMPNSNNSSSASSNVDLFSHGRHLKAYNEKLVAYLQSQGQLVNPLKMDQQEDESLLSKIKHHQKGEELQILTSTNGMLVLAPYISSKKDVANYNRSLASEGVEDEYEDQFDTASSTHQETVNLSENSENRSGVKESINHTISVIVNVKQRTALFPIVRAQFYSKCTNDWPAGSAIAGARKFSEGYYRESFRISRDLRWDLDLEKCDCFIPYKEAVERQDTRDDASEFSLDSETVEEGYVSEHTQDVRHYEILPLEEYLKESKASESLFDEQEIVSTGKLFSPGYYVFNLKIAFPSNIPETIKMPFSKLEHVLLVQTHKATLPALKPPQAAFISTSPHSSHYQSSPMATSRSANLSTSPQPVAESERRGSFGFFKSITHVGSPKRSDSGKKTPLNKKTKGFRYEVPIIRLPPSESETTLNKSIYVNKTWNEAMNYEILFPNKFVRLSCHNATSDGLLSPESFDLQIKLMPLCKGLNLKRIRVNVLEKVSFSSKDMKHEYNVGHDSTKRGPKVRSVTILEVKAKDKSNGVPSRAQKTEIVKNCTNDNLLSNCCTKSKKNDKEVVVTDPIKLNCPINFYAADSSGFCDHLYRSLAQTTSTATATNDLPAHVEEEDFSRRDSVSLFSNPLDSFTMQRSRSPTASSLIHSIAPVGSPSQQCEPFRPKSDRADTGLHPDVNTFSHVSVKHRLQICFRVSKPEEGPVKNGEQPKVHHYEVIIDTPIIFVSPFCNTGNVDLPTYERTVSLGRSGSFSVGQVQPDEVAPGPRRGSLFQPADQEEKLPSFEEALLQPSSPILQGRPVSVGDVEEESSICSSPLSSVSSLSSLNGGLAESNIDSIMAGGARPVTAPSDSHVMRTMGFREPKYVRESVTERSDERCPKTKTSGDIPRDQLNKIFLSSELARPPHPQHEPSSSSIMASRTMQQHNLIMTNDPPKYDDAVADNNKSRENLHDDQETMLGHQDSESFSESENLETESIFEDLKLQGPKMFIQ